VWELDPLGDNPAQALALGVLEEPAVHDDQRHLGIIFLEPPYLARG
jgi:hypothetical protein